MGIKTKVKKHALANEEKYQKQQAVQMPSNKRMQSDRLTAAPFVGG